MLKNEFDLFILVELDLTFRFLVLHSEKRFGFVRKSVTRYRNQRENFLFNQNFIEIQQRNDLEKIQNLIDKRQ